MQQSSQQQQVTNRVAQGLSCFAWNKDASKFAICPSNNEIWIYKTNKSQDTTKWERIQVLKEVRFTLIWERSDMILRVINLTRMIKFWFIIAFEPGELSRLASRDQYVAERIHW